MNNLNITLLYLYVLIMRYWREILAVLIGLIVIILLMIKREGENDKCK